MALTRDKTQCSCGEDSVKPPATFEHTQQERRGTKPHTHRQFDDNDFSNTPPPINQNSNTKKKTKGDHSSEIVNNVVVYEDNEHERGSRTNLQEQLWSDVGGSANEQLRALAASSIGRQHERARETLTAT